MLNHAYNFCESSIRWLFFTLLFFRRQLHYEGIHTLTYYDFIFNNKAIFTRTSGRCKPPKFGSASADTIWMLQADQEFTVLTSMFPIWSWECIVPSPEHIQSSPLNVSWAQGCVWWQGCVAATWCVATLWKGRRGLWEGRRGCVATLWRRWGDAVG